VSFDVDTVSKAIVVALEGLDPTVTCFASPPTTFNPPAYIVGYTTTVIYDATMFGVDVATQPVACVSGPTDRNRAEALARVAKDALRVDPSLGGTVQHLRVVSRSNPRFWSVGGADAYVVDLILEIQA